MTIKAALERIVDMAWDARHGLARMKHQHDVDSDALEVIEDWLLEIKPLNGTEILFSPYNCGLQPEVGKPFALGLLEWYRSLEEMSEAGL